MLSGLFSAKLLAAGIAVAMMVTTVSIYATSISTTTVKRVGAGSVTSIGAPASTVTVDYTLDSSFTVTNASVGWTPTWTTGTDIYLVNVILKTAADAAAGSGQCKETVTSADAKNSKMTITSGGTADTVAKAQVAIQQVTSSAVTACAVGP
jgi:hypothetical protein